MIDLNDRNLHYIIKRSEGEGLNTYILATLNATACMPRNLPVMRMCSLLVLFVLTFVISARVWFSRVGSMEVANITNHTMTLTV